MVKDCVKNCITFTYNFLFANCDEVYQRESKQQTNPTEQNDDGPQILSTNKTTIHAVGSNLKSLQFWRQLMYLLTCIISEDQERYSLIFNQ
jgi:hypothetical protein